MQETTLQTDRKLQELDQSINLRIDHAISQRRSEAFINAQYDTAFPHNGTQLQGATYLEQGARPRTNTFNENPSQNAIHPGNADYNRDTRMRNESEYRQENHNIGRSTNGTNERNHTDDADQSVFRGQVSYMLPKLPTYDGKSTWEAFITTFETLARRMKMTEIDKVDCLLISLRDKAAEFYHTLPQSTLRNYSELIEKLERRFGNIDDPITVRRQLMSLKQNVGEELEEFGERISKLVRQAYPNASTDLQESMAVDHFIRGASDKRAALATAEHTPPPLILADALKMMRSHISNFKAILGEKEKSIKILYSSADSSDEESSIRKIYKDRNQGYGIKYSRRNSNRYRRDYSPKRTSKDYVKSKYNRRSEPLPDYGRRNWNSRPRYEKKQNYRNSQSPDKFQSRKYNRYSPSPRRYDNINSYRHSPSPRYRSSNKD